MCHLTEIFEDKAQAPKRWTHLRSVVATSSLMLIALPFIYCATFAEFLIFDEQGKLMTPIQEILNGRTLYHNISTFYGPFYYFIILRIFNWLNVPFSYDAVRLISATFWFCCSATFATFAWRLTGSA